MACLVLALFKYGRPSITSLNSRTLAISFNGEDLKESYGVWGDIPINQPHLEYSFVAPKLRTKKEFFLALRSNTDKSSLDGRGGGFYFGSAKDSFEHRTGVFDVLRIKNHIKKLSGLKDAGLPKATIRNKIENLVHGVPVGAPVIGRLSSTFGKRNSPFNRASDFHTGVDIASKYNSPVVSSAEGEVVYAGRKGAYGRTILIKHKNNLESLYAHLAKVEVKVGDYVYRGQKIGLVGSSGRSTGPHLHYEVRLDGTPVNPRSFIEIAKIMRSVS